MIRDATALRAAIEGGCRQGALTRRPMRMPRRPRRDAVSLGCRWLGCGSVAAFAEASGDMIVIRYADDTIIGFQHEHEARAFLDDLKDRMRKFELALHPAKPRLVRFGRHAAN